MQRFHRSRGQFLQRSKCQIVKIEALLVVGSTNVFREIFGYSKYRQTHPTESHSKTNSRGRGTREAFLTCQTHPLLQSTIDIYRQQNKLVLILIIIFHPLFDTQNNKLIYTFICRKLTKFQSFKRYSKNFNIIREQTPASATCL